MKEGCDCSLKPILSTLVSLPMEPLRGDNLLFTTQSPRVPGSHLIELGRMEKRADLGTQDHWIGIPVPSPG